MVLNPKWKVTSKQKENSLTQLKEQRLQPWPNAQFPPKWTELIVPTESKIANSISTFKQELQNLYVSFQYF